MTIDGMCMCSIETVAINVLWPKIWIEKDGKRCIEVADSKLSQKDNKMIMEAISNNWEYINEQITRCFNGEKTIIKNIE